MKAMRRVSLTYLQRNCSIFHSDFLWQRRANLSGLWNFHIIICTWHSVSRLFEVIQRSLVQ